MKLFHFSLGAALPVVAYYLINRSRNKGQLERSMRIADAVSSDKTMLDEIPVTDKRKDKIQPSGYVKATGYGSELL